MAVISIDYDGGGNEYDENDNIISQIPIKYKCVELSTGKHGRIKFESGNFIKDWYDAKKKYLESCDDEPFCHSSSVDHFFMDGANYDSAYLHVIEGTPVLKYLDRSKKDWFIDPVGDGWEFFVKEGETPTFDELKEMCK
jgi:hypothetical protein